jgi:putative transposase
MRRHWFAHQVTSDSADRFDLIAFEDFDACNLMQGGPLARRIRYAGWGLLRRRCQYKQVLRSHRYLEVPTAGTTQTCSRGGRVADPPLTLRDRLYRCPCGYEENRDANAARNILVRALASLASPSIS